MTQGTSCTSTFQVNVGTQSISERLASEGVVGLCVCFVSMFSVDLRVNHLSFSDRCERFIACLIARCV